MATLQPNMLCTTGDGSLSTCRRCHAPLASRPKRYTAPLYNLAPRAVACERSRRQTEPVRQDTSVRVLRRHASGQAGGECRAQARTEGVHGRLL